MADIEVLQAGLIRAEKELNDWAGDIEEKAEIVGEDLAHRLTVRC